MRLSISKLVAAAPFAALALGAPVLGASAQSSRPIAGAEVVQTEAAAPAAQAADDGCACECAACLEKHGPKAAPASSPGPDAEAPVVVEGPSSTEVRSRASWKLELQVADGEKVAPGVQESVVEEVPAEDAEMEALARQVEEILATELEDVTEAIVVESVIAAAADEPSASVRRTPAAPPSAEDERGYLGVALEVDDDGVQVAQVVDGSPAAKANLRAGDVLFSVRGESITTLDELREAMAGTKPGAMVVVGYMRDGRPQRARVQLGARDRVIGQGAGAGRAPAAVREARPAPSGEVEPTISAESAPPARNDKSRRRSLLRIAQSETDAPVQAVMTGDDLRIVVMADGTVRVTGSNVRVERRAEGGDASANSTSELDVRFDPERAGSLIDWVRGARGDRPQRDRARRNAARRNADRRNADRRNADRRNADRRNADRGDADRGDAARGGAARRDGDRPDAARGGSAGRDAARGDAPRPDAARAAALRRRIREMSAEIDRLSRQIQRIGRALGERDR